MDSLRKPNIERLAAAMRHQKMDRVPHFEDVIDPAMTGHILGKPAPLGSAALSAGDALMLAQRTCQDAVTFIAGPSIPFGSIRTEADLDGWAPPDPSGVRAQAREFCRELQGTGVGVNAIIWGPFMIAYLAMGPTPIQDFLLKVYEDRAFVERVLERSLEAQLGALDAILDLPIDIIEIADDTCDSNGFICSEPLMEELWVPRIEKIVRLAKQKGAPIQWHCCGKVDALIPRLVDWGIDLIEPIQARCNDIYALKEQYAGRIAFRGNMNIEGVLAFGTPEEVRSDTREHIERLSFDGGYIASSSHSIVDAIPPANYFAMIDAILEYGRYR